MFPLIRRAGGFPGPLLTLMLILCVGCFACPLPGAEAVRRPFALAAGGAEVTLEAFSVQADAPVVFPLREVRGVATNPVHGDFAPREALQRLVAGTGLEVRRDGETGSFIVRRERPDLPPQDQEPATNPTTAKPRQTEPHPMPKTKSTNSPRALIAALAGWLVASTPLDAQTTPAPAVTPEAAIMLSPFNVSTERDTGYAATNTLAGTRLNTPVADIGASLSIYTKDFLNDIGATNANDLLIFATGMEAAGPGGNYSGAAASISTAEVFSEGARANPQGATRTRGLASPNFTRGFFGTSIPFDSYNTDTVTVNRGPNAILFGVGSPAGVVDTTLIRPDLRRNKTQVQTRFGNNAGYRGSLDVNRALIPGKLGLRIAALHDREEYNQRPAFEEKRRVYGALTFEPFRSTTLRANFESGRTRANRPITVLPFNDVTTYWQEEGKPVSDWAFYDDPARNPLAASQNAVNFRSFTYGTVQLFDQIAVTYSNPNSSLPDNGFRAVTPASGTNAANTLRNGVFNPTLNRDLNGDAIQFLGTVNINRIVPAFWTGSRVFPGQQPGYAPAGLKAQGFTDYSAFDFDRRMLDESSRQGDSLRAFNISLEQRALNDRIGVEVAYDTQRYDRRAKNSFFSSGNSNHIYIDINTHLPTGEMNPNLGRPVAHYGQSTWSVNANETEAWRATAFARHDFKDSGPAWMRWLGRHVLTGVYEQNAVEGINYSYRLATDGPAAQAINPSVATFGRYANALVYVGPSIIGNNNPLRLEPIRVPSLTATSALTASYLSRQANATDPGRVVSAPLSFVEINNGGGAQREVIRSQSAALQSYWLKDHLVTVVGWRRDEDYFASNAISGGSPFFAAPIVNQNDPGKVHYGFSDLSFPDLPPPNVAKEIKSYSAVLKWPKGLVRLPRGMNLSAFYNVSENFTPAAGRVDPYNRLLASPQGETKEHGFNLSFLDGKLGLRVNRFRTGVLGQTSGNPPLGTASGNAIAQQITFWAVEGNTNPNNVPLMNLAIQRLVSTLPPDYLSLRSVSISGQAPNISAASGNLRGITDTVDYSASGTEIELVYNPTKKWRILANVAKQETVQSNSYPIAQEFIARMLPIWNSTLTDPVSGVTLKMTDLPRANWPEGTGPANPNPQMGTYGAYLEQFVFVPLATALATDGTASAEQRKWRANLVSNYSFGSDSVFGSRLQGWSVGGGLRWQDKLGIGYPTTRNPDGTVNIDIKRPFYAPQETTVDAWVGYERKLWQKRIGWKVQLSVRNLIADRTPIAITVQPWGEVASVRTPPEQRWYLTNTFNF